ncbi:MAG: hypothetical protein ACM3RQ_00585 [Methanocella sp.]
MARAKSKNGHSKTSAYRSRRILKGYRRLEITLNPEARKAIDKLHAEGLSNTTAVNKALIEYASRKR